MYRARLLTLLAYAWAAPTTLVGLLFIVPALLTGGGVRWHTGVLEVYGGAVRLFLRYCTLLPGGAAAMTLGHVVIATDRSTLNWSRKHERVHVRQAERWGPLFIPAYVLVSIWIWLCGGNGYAENPFEREAYEQD